MRKMSFILTVFLITCITLSCDKQSNDITERYGWDVKELLNLEVGDYLLHGDVETVTFTFYEVDNKFGKECIKDTSDVLIYSFNTNGDVSKIVKYNSDGEICYVYSYTYNENKKCIEEFYNNKYLEQSYHKYDKYESAKYWFDYEYKNKLRYDSDGNVIEILKYNHNDELISHTNNIIDDNGNVVETIILETNELINPFTYSHEHEYIKYETETRVKYLYNTEGKCIEEYECVSTNRNNKSESKQEIRREFSNNEIVLYIDRDCVGTTKELIRTSKTKCSNRNDGNLIETIYSCFYKNGIPVNDSATYLYNDNGNLIKVIQYENDYFGKKDPYYFEDEDNYDYYIEYCYDDEERCISEIIYNSDDNINEEIHSYDINGNMTETCMYNDKILQSKKTYSYDKMNNIIEYKSYNYRNRVESTEYIIKVDIKYRNNIK